MRKQASNEWNKFKNKLQGLLNYGDSIFEIVLKGTNKALKPVTNHQQNTINNNNSNNISNNNTIIIKTLNNNNLSQPINMKPPPLFSGNNPIKNISNFYSIPPKIEIPNILTKLPEFDIKSETILNVSVDGSDDTMDTDDDFDINNQNNNNNSNNINNNNNNNNIIKRKKSSNNGTNKILIKKNKNGRINIEEIKKKYGNVDIKEVKKLNRLWVKDGMLMIVYCTYIIYVFMYPYI